MFEQEIGKFPYLFLYQGYLAITWCIFDTRNENIISKKAFNTAQSRSLLIGRLFKEYEKNFQNCGCIKARMRYVGIT